MEYMNTKKSDIEFTAVILKNLNKFEDTLSKDTTSFLSVDWNSLCTDFACDLSRHEGTTFG